MRSATVPACKSQSPPPGACAVDVFTGLIDRTPPHHVTVPQPVRYCGCTRGRRGWPELGGHPPDAAEVLVSTRPAGIVLTGQGGLLLHDPPGGEDRPAAAAGVRHTRAAGLPQRLPQHRCAHWLAMQSVNAPFLSPSFPLSVATCTRTHARAKLARTGGSRNLTHGVPSLHLYAV